LANEGGDLSAALRFEGVSFSYGSVPALNDVTFSVAPGERVALLGRNGAGKSTLARLVAGLITPAAGTVWVGDWDTRDLAPENLARRVGSLFQHADQQLFATTLEEDVRFGPRALGLEPGEVVQRADEALDALDLREHASRHPYDLPPAFRKLAALAGVLALEPAVFVLDEPTSGLDRALRARVARALLERSAAGAALLVITHDLSFAAELLDRAVVLDGGRLACDEPLGRLLADAGRLEPLGLEPPPVAALSAALELPGRPIRAADAARALARVAGGSRVP
jgi:energy-coupling factor transporter ATP-binding protein EcfA2